MKEEEENENVKKSEEERETMENEEGEIKEDGKAKKYRVPTK